MQSITLNLLVSNFLCYCHLFNFSGRKCEESIGNVLLKNKNAMRSPSCIGVIMWVLHALFLEQVDLLLDRWRTTN